MSTSKARQTMRRIASETDTPDAWGEVCAAVLGDTGGDGGVREAAMARATVRMAVCHAMQCPSCGTILDTRRAWLLEGADEKPLRVGCLSCLPGIREQLVAVGRKLAAKGAPAGETIARLLHGSGRVEVVTVPAPGQADQAPGQAKPKPERKPTLRRPSLPPESDPIARARAFASKDKDDREALTVVQVQDGRAYASNGHRIAVLDAPGERDRKHPDLNLAEFVARQTRPESRTSVRWSTLAGVKGQDWCLLRDGTTVVVDRDKHPRETVLCLDRQYLLEALDGRDGVLEWTDSCSVTRIRFAGDEHWIMPVRV